MPLPETAFRHHPALRALIADPETSWFRTMRTAEVRRMIREAGGDDTFIRARSDREADRRAALSRRPDGPLWVFAYGSLMWDPAFFFDEVRRARAPEHARSFCLWDDSARGSPAAPGLMAGLDRGAGCTGYAFRIAEADVERETEILCRRELIAHAYLPEYLPLETDQGPVTALAFVVNHGDDRIRTGLPLDEQAAMIARATGLIGTNRAYLENLAEHLRALDIEDGYVQALWDRVRGIGACAGQAAER